MIYVGIDPGRLGGIAALTAKGKVQMACCMPSTERDVLDVLQQIVELADGTHAVLEFVRSSPQMGVASAFKFGCGYGGLRMALIAAGIAFDEATPLKWQNALGCRSRGDKNVTKRRAQELFPGIKCNHYISDALLLAEYARRLHSGKA